MKKLSAVIVVLAVLFLALWLVMRDDRGPGDTVATDPAAPESETTDTATSDTDDAPEEDATAAAVSEDDAAVTDAEMVSGADEATGDDGTADAMNGDGAAVTDDELVIDADGAPEEDGIAVAVSEDDADEMVSGAEDAPEEDGTTAAVSGDDSAAADVAEVVSGADEATGDDGTAVTVSGDDSVAADADEMVIDADGAPEEDGTAAAVSEDDAGVAGTDEMVSGADDAPEEDGTTVAVSGDDATAAGADEMVSDADEATGEEGAAVAMSGDDAAVTDDDDELMEEDTGEAAGPDFDVVRVEVTGDAVMAGVGEPGATIVVTSGDDVVGETVADDAGAWVIVTEDPLDPGSHELKLTSVNGDGETTQSDTVVVVSVPQEPAEGETGDVLTVMMNDEDGSEVEVIQGGEDGVGLSGGGDLALESLSYDEEGSVSMGGQATTGNSVIVYVDDRVAGVADVDDGEWSVALDESVDEGIHSLRIDEVNEEGDVVARLETPFVRAVFIMPDASDQLVVIQPGNNLWRIARRTYGRGILFTLIYEANRSQIADPDLIYPGQIFVMPQDRVAEN